MEDDIIVELFWDRDEGAIRETQNKYEGYLYKIAYNILASNEDSGECVNDTYLKAWESMPPNRPQKLSGYLGAITRNLAITVFRRQRNVSHAPSQYAVSLDELSECVSGGETPEGHAEYTLLGKCISDYLRTISMQARNIFICRYYFADSIKDIASYFGASETKIKSSLYRTRNGLKEHLIKEGFDV